MLKTRSRSGLEPLASAIAATARPLEVLDFGVIGVLILRIKDALRVVVDSEGTKGVRLRRKDLTTGEHRVRLFNHGGHERTLRNRSSSNGWTLSAELFV